MRWLETQLERPKLGSSDLEPLCRRQVCGVVLLRGAGDWRLCRRRARRFGELTIQHQAPIAILADRMRDGLDLQLRF